MGIIDGDIGDKTQAGLKTALTFRDWYAEIEQFIHKEILRQLARLALGVAFLRGKSRQMQNASRRDLALVWELIHGAITNRSLSRPLCNASRSAQGFLSVALCSLVKDGNIDELFRLHVWLPDGQRGNKKFSVHSHQSFGQSWILAGEGKDYSYIAQPASSHSDATHAEYALAWSDGKSLGQEYNADQTYSIVVNTHKLATVTSTKSSVHTRDLSYCIPEAAYHSTEVRPDILHATLFLFDSSRGFVKGAGVMGPKDAESYVQVRDPANQTAAELADMTDAVRMWEIFMEEGQHHARQAEWEPASRSFNSALNLCNSVRNFPNTDRYRFLVLGELGKLRGHIKLPKIFWG